MESRYDDLHDRDLGDPAETKRSLRDMGALLALPALWVDHEPAEIATGLLSVLFGVLRLDGAYVCFNDPDGGSALEEWRPSGPVLPPELARSLAATDPVPAGITTTSVPGEHSATMRVTSVPLALPWETGLVLVSAARNSFPTAAETRLLRIAISQGAIAVHTARRLAREHSARMVAEAALARQGDLLRALTEDVESSLASIVRRVHEGSVHLAEPGPARADAAVAFRREDASAAQSGALPLTRREAEVLGLLAQGLSNKEIAGVMWLSDRTVERHITSVYRKIGVVRRSEATAFALRHGVI
jgi:DNA-binding NarL/FixJ family response regulator